RITPAVAGPRTATITLGTTPAPEGSVAVRANGAVGALRATPSPLNLGTQPVGTLGAGHPLTLTNAGTVPLMITRIALTGPGGAVFGLPAAGTTCPLGGGPLAVNASCTVGVAFHPDTLGVHLGGLRVEAIPMPQPNPLPRPAPGGIPLSLTVSLAGIGAPAVLTARPNPVRLAAGPLGRAGPRPTVLVRNPGPGPARIGTVTLTGPDAARFRLAASGCAGVVLPAKATCPITVWLHPDRTGTLAASLVLTSTDLAAPLVVPLSGAASKPVLRLTPAVARPGQVVLARGTGFPPGSTVTLAWLSGITV